MLCLRNEIWQTESALNLARLLSSLGNLRFSRLLETDAHRWCTELKFSGECEACSVASSLDPILNRRGRRACTDQGLSNGGWHV